MTPDTMWYPFYCIEETISFEQLSTFLSNSFTIWAYTIFNGRISSSFLQLYSDKIDNLAKTGYFFHSD